MSGALSHKLKQHVLLCTTPLINVLVRLFVVPPPLWPPTCAPHRAHVATANLVLQDTIERIYVGKSRPIMASGRTSCKALFVRAKLKLAGSN